jgi:hypothetical protein
MFGLTSLSIRASLGRWSAAALHWLAGCLSEADGTPSTKRLLYATAVVAALLFCAFDMAMHGGITDKSLDLTKLIIETTTAAYTVTRFAEKNGSGPTPPPAPATT